MEACKIRTKLTLLVPKSRNDNIFRDPSTNLRKCTNLPGSRSKNTWKKALLSPCFNKNKQPSAVQATENETGWGPTLQLVV